MEFDLKTEVINMWNKYSHELNYDTLYENCKGNFYETESQFLYSILRHVKPSVVLEMSPNYGFTSSIILEALDKNVKQSKLYSFDIRKESERYNRENGLVQRELIVGDVKTTLDDSLVEKSDFFLIDSDHSYEFGVWYSKKVDKLRKGVFVMIHDWPMYESNGACDNIVPEFAQPTYLEYLWNLEVSAVKKYIINRNILLPIMNITDFLKESGKPYYYTFGAVEHKALSPSQILIKT